MDSAGKRVKSQNRRTGRLCRPVLQLPTGQSLQLTRRSWRTWNEQVGAKQTERNGANDEKGSGHGMAKVSSRHTACRTRPLQANTAGRWSARHRPQKTTASSWPASQQNNSRRQSWPASRRAVQEGGGSTMVLAIQQAGSDLPNSLPPTYRLCLSLSLPTPLI